MSIVLMLMVCSCGKETAEKQSLKPDESSRPAVSFESFISENYTTWKGELPQALTEGCGETEYGLNCKNVAYLPVEMNITDAATGCIYKVKMMVKECPSNGSTYVLFKLVDFIPTNNTTPPCDTWWNWFVSLPENQFAQEEHALEDRLTSVFIHDFMVSYTLQNPIHVQCVENNFYNAVFFRPICTRLCGFGSGRDWTGFYRVLCASDGCCALTTSYCILNGQVLIDGPIPSELSPCTEFVEINCKLGSSEIGVCDVHSCNIY